MSRPIYIYITPFFPHPDWHSGVYSYDFIKELSAQSDYNVKVFYPGHGSDYDYHGFRVYRFPVKHLPGGAFPLLFARWNCNSFLRKIREAGIEIGDIAVCHGHTAEFSIYPLALKKINSSVKTLLHHHDLASVGLRLGAFRHVWINKVINYIAYRNLFERIDLHVFISNACKNSFLKFPNTEWSVFDDYKRLGSGMQWLRPIKVRRSIVLWNGVDTQTFSRDFHLQKHKGPGFVVGCVANFIEVKDHLCLVKAVETLQGKIPGLKLRLLGKAGFGNYYKKTLEYIKDNALEQVVTIEDNCSHEEMAGFYHSLDLFVLPSFFEGFGCVIAEASSCGIPFVACKGQGADELLLEEDRDLWLFDPKSVSDLASKILNYFLNKPTQRLSGRIDMKSKIRDFLAELSRLEEAHD